MNLIPDEEMQWKGSLNLAPLVDFLFLVIAVFATLAITRTALYDSEVELVKVSPPKENAIPPQEVYVVNLSVTGEGKYKWITDFNEYNMDGAEAIKTELTKQQKLGLIPTEKNRTKVLLHIDKNAQWQPIVDLIFSVKQSGFAIYPVYEEQRLDTTEPI